MYYEQSCLQVDNHAAAEPVLVYIRKAIMHLVVSLGVGRCRRPGYQYEAERIEGAVNISTFRPVAGKGKWDVIKKIAMGALAMKATGQPCTFFPP